MTVSGTNIVSLLQIYRSALLSRVLDRITFVQNGVDDTRKIVNATENLYALIYIGENNRINGRFKNENISHSVSTVLLSDIINDISLKVNNRLQLLIKMDIEGMECNAFLGSAKELTDNSSVSIVAVIMEWTFQKFPFTCSSTKVLKLKQLFLYAGYIPFLLNDKHQIKEGRNLIKLSTDDQHWKTNNIFDIVWIKNKTIIKALYH